MENYFAEVKEIGKLRLGGFIGVFIAMIFMFLIVPLFAKSFFTHMALQISFIFLILSTIYSISRNKNVLIIGLFFLLPYIFFELLSLYEGNLKYTVVAYVFSLIFTFFAICILIKKILWSPSIDTNLIFGSITIYLLAAILWAKMYFLENIIIPGSFHANSLNFYVDSLPNAYEIQFNLLYYSFTVVTSLGIGDISPVHNLAKSLTALEAMFGQLFIAIIISKLVSIWRHSKNSEKNL